MSGRAPIGRRKSSLHYMSLPTSPPHTRGRPPSKDGASAVGTSPFPPSEETLSSTSGDDAYKYSTQLPKKQLLVLAVMSLAEQTALNSFSPYMPTMASGFPEVDGAKLGLYVGAIASSFAAAQFATNVWWGRLSDRIGRKPVLLLGTLLTSFGFFAFGFCRTLWQAIIVQVIIGTVNGNAGIVSTVLGEITDRSNQSTAFSYLPMVYGIGAITGPLIGGVLVDTAHGNSSSIFGRYPYLLPNIVSGIILIADFIFAAIFLEESLKEAADLPPLGARVKNLFTWLWQFTASYRPTYLQTAAPQTPGGTLLQRDDEERPELFPDMSEPASYRSILAPQIVILLITYTLFNLSNIAFNSLYPIFASAPLPTGRDLSPKEIGISLSFAGAISIVFQALLFTTLQHRLGNRWTYRLAFIGFIIAFFSMPLIGKDIPKPRIWAELGVVLFIKTVAAVGGLTCAMLLITNASPKPNTLGTLNGLAQTLSAGGRAFGPLVAGGLFTAGVKEGGNGEWLPWGVFGGIAAVGLGMAFGLRARRLDGDELAPLLSEEGFGIEREEED